MSFSKWTIYQFLVILTLIILVYLVNGLGISVAITEDTSNEGRIFRSILTAGFLIALVACIYVIIFCQHKKRPNMLSHSIWSKTPTILFAVGFISIVLFLSLGTFGPLLDWIEHVRWLLYVILIYFIWGFFLFVMSIIVKIKGSQNRVIEHTFVWTCLILLVFIFII
ncbi:hypothetical protein GCM10007063_33310 [Lentibacillus kapialis]|uniref:Uncharacterized protein n=1 Tax=Lentibacillus kapialis TaxID=340214 RepID=A0A917Q2T5_9BACI|nr:hypothetical protein [Lentibacillus kapialis]GGK08254.1 hypothetical protein GCM10007063_33310 [Lentibacillus kapialis]